MVYSKNLTLTSSAVFFSSQEHLDNFNAINQLYENRKMNDSQYQAHFYIAAVPEIFELISLNKLDGRAPLVSLMEYSEEEKTLLPAHGGLTGSTIRLLKVGMNLFNGFECDLDYKPSQEHGEILIQAMIIRWGL